ncbi:hypothetical protein N9917_00115 [Deltaproteobacteria bacterium]|nr:hypothetical protein [Deltaproteobacteria bacterium]
MPEPEFNLDRYVFVQQDVYDPNVLYIYVLNGDEEPNYDTSMPIPDSPYPLHCNVNSEEEYKAMEETARTVAAEEGGLDVVMSHACVQCSKPEGPDYYMVTDEVWQQAQVPALSVLHLHCLEARLGRRLTIVDFTDVPVNRLIHYGFSLRLPVC